MWQVLVALTIVLVVTLVGHGIWVLVAMLFRALAGSPGREQPLLRLCGSCGHRTSARGDRCEWCGVPLDDPRLAEIADYSAFVRHVQRLEKAGALSADAAGELLARAKTHHQQQLERARGASAAAAAERPAAPLPAAAKVPAQAYAAPAGEIPVAELVDEPAPPPTPPSKPVAQPQAPPPLPQPPRPGPEPAHRPRPEPAGATGVSPVLPPAHGQDARGTPRPAVDGQDARGTPMRPGDHHRAERPARSWGQLLEAFMEERNIRWGELIGGLLIVGGGVALAISLREQLQAIPYSQFLVFAAITAAVYGMGFYSHYRWKLATTSRGLLTIAMLLTPVSFLIMAALAGGDSRLLTLGVEGAGLATFGYLAYAAARVLVPDRPALAVLGTVGNSAAVLGSAWLAAQSIEPLWATGAGLLPAGIFLGAMAGYLLRREARRWLDVDRSVWMLTLLGTSAFAWIVAEGHTLAELVKHTELPVALGRLSLPLAVAAAVPLVWGLVLLRRTTRGAAMEAYRTAGTAIALIGMTAMLVALGLAWPRPEMIIAVGLVDTVVLALAALRYRMPLLHAGAIFCTALVVLVGYHAIDGRLFGQPTDGLGRQLLVRIVSAPSGNLLGALFVVSAGLAEWLVRVGRWRDGRVYAVGCGVLAAVGLSLVTWHGTAGGADALRAAILYAVYGLIGVGLAVRWNKLALSYLGLALVQGAMLWAAWWQQQPLWLALLAFASTATAVGLALQLIMRRREPLLRVHLGRLVVEPCVHAALVSIAAALPWLLLAASVSVAALAGYLAWLSALATILAFMIGRPELLAAAQGVWVLAAIAAARAWIEWQPAWSWTWPLRESAWSWPDTRILLAYGVALAALGVVWNTVRLALRGNRRVRRLLNPPWPATDQVVHHGLVLAQWLVLGVCLLPHIGRQLGTGAGSASPSFFGLSLEVGPEAWLLLGLLAAASLLRLWQRFEDVDLLSLLLIVTAAAGLVAGRFAGQVAVESALRWALSVAFLLASAVIWSRTSVAGLARACGVRARLGPPAVPLARGLLVATTAVPIVALTVLAVVLELSGTSPAGPIAGTFFEKIGSDWSYLVPLILVVIVLVGYALRERSAVHAFGAGAVVELAVALGYLLNVRDFGTAELVCLVQLVTIASAVWAVAWLLGRRWTDAWAEQPGHLADRSNGCHGHLARAGTGETPVAPSESHSVVRRSALGHGASTGRVLMSVQLAEGVLGSAILLLPALVWLGLWGAECDVRPTTPAGFWLWTSEVGGPIGWAALLSVFGAIAYRWAQAGRQVDPSLVGLVGMAALGLFACTVFRVSPEWGFRSLVLGWAIYAVLVAMATWWLATLRTLPGAFGPPQALIRAAAVWVRCSAVPAVVLGLWGSLHYDEQPWAATAIAIASLSGAIMAVWLRREGWALAAALGVNLAASLAVWHHCYELPLVDWWTELARANIIASASVGLVWLAAVRRLYQLREPTVRQNPLLTLQVAVPAAGQTILCLLPIAHLAWQPAGLTKEIAALGCPAGWLALALAVAAAGWHAVRISRENVTSIAAAAVLGAVALGTCHTARLSEFGSYYCLTTALAAAGLLIVVAGMFAQRLVDRDYVSQQAVAAWATAVGLLVVVLSLIHCGEDPYRPWWFASTLLSVSVTAGLLAVWLRRAEYVCASGLMLNAVGTVIWYIRGPEGVLSLIEVNILCLGIGSVLWSAIGLLDTGRVARRPLAGLQLPYTHLAAAVALLGSIALVVARLYLDVVAIEHIHAEALSWISLGASAAALAMLLGDRSAAWTRPGLYLLGLAGVGLGLDTRWLTGEHLAWTAAIDLAAFALVAAVVGWVLARWLPRRRMTEGQMTDDSTGWLGADWFSSMQRVVVIATAILAGWVSLDLAFETCVYPGWDLLAGRAAGPIAAAVLLGASLVMVRQTSGAARVDWQLATMLLGSATLCYVGWWQLAAGGASLWLHRAVVLMAAAALGAIGSGVIAVRSGLGRDDWLAAAARATVMLGGLAVAALVCTLGLEVHFHVPDGTPMADWAIATVAATLLGLAAGCICLAVVPGADPLGLSLRGRTVYVYAAEAIGVLLGVHLWLTVPELFRLEIIEQYWMYLVMLVAFVGAGLAEWFHRRGVGVLAEPLERTALALPLAPALGFWMVTESTPAFWFLATLFYGVMAINRRSGWMALAAVVTGNLGLWVLWHRWELNFLDRPQLWLIPAALCALVAEYVHHDRLREGPSAAIRYMALSMIYVSSTVEFMRGVGESVWLPLVLIGLSLTGVLAGILLRVQSFLYLGVTFVLFVLVRMIFYAAFQQGQMWVFWSACVCLGAVIIGLFAVFEKRRNDVLAALGRFKQWEK